MFFLLGIILELLKNITRPKACSDASVTVSGIRT